MSTVISPMYAWQDLRWQTIERRVFKLQKRIYQASRRGQVKAMRKLQRLLMASWSARGLAVRKVTQDNQGKKTPGVDGKASLTPRERQHLVTDLRHLQRPAQPVRRVYLRKPNGEPRPLGIPTMHDRAMQALVKLALEPEWEAKFEPNSYGFRPGRSCHDALEAIFASTKYTPRYVLDADIKGCFDHINHAALLAKLHTFPQLHRLMKGWLKAGIMEGEVCSPAEAGTPQGGVASPLLANIALHGMEEAVTRVFPHRRRAEGNVVSWSNKPKLIRYADDRAPRRRGKEKGDLEASCCTRDGGRPSGAGVQDQASNHLQLRELRASVVSVAGKGEPRARQVWVKQTNASEPLRTCRKRRDDVKTGASR